MGRSALLAKSARVPATGLSLPGFVPRKSKRSWQDTLPSAWAKDDLDAARKASVGPSQPTGPSPTVLKPPFRFCLLSLLLPSVAAFYNEKARQNRTFNRASLTACS